MEIKCKYWKDKQDGKWIIDIPALDILTQAEDKHEISSIARDAIREAVNDDDFRFIVGEVVAINIIRVTTEDYLLLAQAIVKRQKEKFNTKEDVCIWTENICDTVYLETSCGGSPWDLEGGELENHDIIYCHHCGRKVELNR